MSNKDSALYQRIESDPRVVELAQSRGQFGGVSNAELRQLGYDVPEHVKYALAQPKGGKNWRAVGNNGTAGFVYRETPGVGKIIALTTAGVLLAPFAAPAIANAFGGGAAAAAPTVNGVTTALPGAIASQGASAGIGAAGTAASVASKALSTAVIARDVVKSFASGAGDAADTMAGNRGTRMEAAAVAEQMNQGKRREDRESRADAMKAAQQAAYLSDPNRGRSPGVAGAYSRNLNLPPLDPAIVAARRDEAAKRLQTPYQDFAFATKDLNASGAEKALGIGSTVAGVASAIPDSILKKLGRLVF